MRTLIALLVPVFFLAACASLSPPNNIAVVTPLDAQTGSVVPVKGSHAYGTLAEYGSVEWVLAPHYTRIELLNKTAARRAKDGRLSKAFAQTIERQTRGALERLRDARVFADRPEVFEARVAQTKALLDSAQELLEEGGK